METLAILSLILLILGISIYVYTWEGKAPQHYNIRKCTGKEWKAEFPEVPKETIRAFLECFVDGMAFSSNERLKFNPSDKVIDVYKAIYGGKIPRGDAMEYETFYDNLLEEYGVSSEHLEQVWNENMTLGGLFRHTNAQQDAQSKLPPIKT